MLIILYSLFFILLLVVALFAFPRFSPIPYFPSNKNDLSGIVKALSLKSNQIVIDLGAGDGAVIFEAAKEARRRKLNTRFVAVDINLILLIILFLRRLFHPNHKNIRILYADMFSIDYSFYPADHLQQTTFYLYISPWYLEKTIENIRRQLRHFYVVSYMYPVKSLLKDEKRIKGFVHDIFIYRR